MQIIDEMKPKPEHKPALNDDKLGEVLAQLFNAFMWLLVVGWVLYCIAYTDGKLDVLEAKYHYNVSKGLAQ